MDTHPTGRTMRTAAPMPSPLQFTTHTFQDTPLVRLSGSLVFGHDVNPLIALARELRAQGHMSVILELRDVTATDSTGLGAILEFRRVLGDDEGAVYLLQPSERLRTHLAVSHVESMFIVADSEEDLSRYLTQKDH
jgi:anti-anti-sigma factor